MSEKERIDPLLELARARLGKLFKERWRLDSLLGIGGMAAVYAATHRTGSRVAIKVLHPELSIHGEFRARFLREAYATNAVGHPGVVKVLDDDVSDDGSVFLVMELLEGESLQERWTRLGKKLDPVEVLMLADQLLDVLAAAHAKGIIHRDIKPANLVVLDDGTLKVLDFGIARLHDLSSEGADATQTGALMGTPGYMAPEQARGDSKRMDARTDLWAVGATLFSLLSGKRVHRAETPGERLVAAMTAQAPSLRSVLPDIDGTIAALVDHALAFHQENRWPDARSMQLAVRDAKERLLQRLTMTGDAPVSVRESPPVSTPGDRAQTEGPPRTSWRQTLPIINCDPAPRAPIVDDAAAPPSSRFEPEGSVGARADLLARKTLKLRDWQAPTTAPVEWPPASRPEPRTLGSLAGATRTLTGRRFRRFSPLPLVAGGVVLLLGGSVCVIYFAGHVLSPHVGHGEEASLVSVHAARSPPSAPPSAAAVLPPAPVEATSPSSKPAIPPAVVPPGLSGVTPLSSQRMPWPRSPPDDIYFDPYDD